MTEAEIAFKVETPMFIGGTPGSRAEFRLPSLRGAMRFWFRAFAGPLYGNDLGKMAEAEASVFGAASGGRVVASAVSLRPLELPHAPPRQTLTPLWLRDHEYVAYMLGPGLFQPRENVTRHSVEAGATGSFALRSASSDKSRLAAICLWALSVFGGLGMRVHRGFGGISFTGLEDIWPDVPERIPLEDVVGVQEEFAACLGSKPSPVLAQGYPSFPSFSSWHCRVSTQRFSTWQAALNDAGENLRLYRAPVDRSGRADLAGQPWRHRVTREYGDVILPQLPPGGTPAAHDFELAAFGLPVVFSQTGVGTVATVNLTMAGKEMRRASPLWIRPWPRPSGGWGLVYHVFEAELWPGSADLDLKVHGQPRPVTLSLTAGQAYAKLRQWVGQAP